MDNDLIEIAPLAYMRGRTLNDAVVILDEGQNATVPQMKMFLTRMGQNARIVVTGDITQVDLPPATEERAGRRRRAARPDPRGGDGPARPLGHRPPSAGAGDRQRLRGERGRIGRVSAGPGRVRCGRRAGGPSARPISRSDPCQFRPPRSEAARCPPVPALEVIIDHEISHEWAGCIAKPGLRRPGTLLRGMGTIPGHADLRRGHEYRQTSSETLPGPSPALAATVSLKQGRQARQRTRAALLGAGRRLRSWRPRPSSTAPGLRSPTGSASGPTASSGSTSRSSTSATRPRPATSGRPRPTRWRR